MTTYTGTDELTYDWDGTTLTVTGTGKLASASFGSIGTTSGTLNASGLKHLIIGEGITGVVGQGFRSCTSLLDIQFPQTLTAIYWACFYGCSALTKIDLPKNFSYFEGSIFGACSSVTTLIFQNTDPLDFSHGGGTFQVGGGNQVDVYSQGWASNDTIPSADRGNFVYHTGYPQTYKYLTTDGYKIKVDMAVRDGEGYEISTQYQKKNRIISNTSVSSWSSDNTYSDYPYRASIAVTGVTANDTAEVVFAVAQAVSGDYAPVCETYAGGVYIYSAVNDSITVPTIIIFKG